MADWQDVRAHIAGVLEGIEISEPVDARIEHVQQHPPAKIDSYPCFVILPAQSIKVDVLSGWRTETREVACRYIGATGDDIALAGEIAEAFREAAIAAFDEHNGLGGTGSLLERRAEDFGVTQYGGRSVVYWDLILVARYETAAPQS